MNDPATYPSADLGLMEPDPIAYSFATPGWQGLGIALILLALILVLRAWVRYRKNAYRRAAMKQVQELKIGQAANPVFELNLILKELAMQQFGSEAVASLHGQAWLEFLARSAPGLVLPPEPWQETYLDSLYGKEPMKKEDWQYQLDLATHWIKRHDARKF